MKSILVSTLGKFFITFYVMICYVRHYMFKFTIRRVLTFIILIAVFVAIVLDFGLQVKLTGNDHLNQAYDHQNSNRNTLAYTSFEKALQAFNDEKNARGVLVSSSFLGDIDMNNENYGVALAHYDQALKFAQFLNYEPRQINLLKKHAELKLKLGRVNAARAHFLDAIKIAQDTNNIQEQGIIFTKIGNLERENGNDRRAKYAYRNALNAYGSNKKLKGQASLHWQLANLETSLGNYDIAINSYLIARDIYRQNNNIYNEANIFKYMARLETKRGQLDQAEIYYNEAATFYASIGKISDLDNLKNETNLLN